MLEGWLSRSNDLKYNSQHPVNYEDGMLGWMSPEGSFFRCGYGEHGSLASYLMTEDTAPVTLEDIEFLEEFNSIDDEPEDTCENPIITSEQNCLELSKLGWRRIQGGGILYNRA